MGRSSHAGPLRESERPEPEGAQRRTPPNRSSLAALARLGSTKGKHVLVSRGERGYT